MSDESPPPEDSTEPAVVMGDAVATAAPCSLRWAVDAGGPLARACRSRSEALAADAFEVRCGGSDGRALVALAARGGKVLATLRRGELDMMFVVPVTDVEERGSAGSYVARLALPERMLVSARRGMFRVDILPSDVDVFARVWQIEDRVPLRDRPKASQERLCLLHDLSGGGARMTLSARHGPAISMRVGQRVRVDLTAGGRVMQFDGRLRNAGLGETAGETRCGVEFVAHEHDLAWRQDAEYLHHVLAELQRRSAYRRATAA